LHNPIFLHVIPHFPIRNATFSVPFFLSSVVKKGVVFMSSDDSFRGGSHYSQNRKPGMSKGQGYSPSMNYNYNNGNQTQHGNHGSHGNSSFNSQQHQRRKSGTFKRENTGGGANDRIVKQNDIIIRLLKEIRDRLPPPPVIEGESEVGGTPDETTSSDQNETVSAGDEQQNFLEPQEVLSPSANVNEDDEDLDSQVNGNI
jgi:hypothetical protein